MAVDPSDISQTLRTRPPHRSLTFTLRGLLTTLVVIALLGISFWGGTEYQKHHQKVPAATASAGQGQYRQFGSNGNRNDNRFGGGNFGQVTAISTSSVTVQSERTGASTTYAITSSTTITDNDQAVSVNDIQTGDTVLVTPSGTDSSTASHILVNPSFGGGFSQSPENTTGN